MYETQQRLSHALQQDFTNFGDHVKTDVIISTEKIWKASLQ